MHCRHAPAKHTDRPTDSEPSPPRAVAANYSDAHSGPMGGRAGGGIGGENTRPARRGGRGQRWAGSRSVAAHSASAAASAASSDAEDTKSAGSCVSSDVRRIAARAEPAAAARGRRPSCSAIQARSSRLWATSSGRRWAAWDSAASMSSRDDSKQQGMISNCPERKVSVGSKYS